ncbi:FK506-binding protein 5-like isoform X2 [Trichogramma pretiosum]|nr:FK506-binding protein 5-like isoform X2 [Trichogramma pretiosum]
MRPIEQILFDSIEETTEIIEETSETIEAEPEKEPVEEYPEKPRDQNSDPVPNKNLTDEEIAQLILDEEEVLRVKEKGVLGVDFKKLRPRAPLLKESKVFAELQQEANTDPVEIQKQNALSSTFLQRPDRPVPKPRLNSVSESEAEVEPYRVVIKKQPKKSVTEKLLKKGLIDSSRLSQTPEPTPPAEQAEEANNSTTPEPKQQAAVSETESRPQSQAEIIEIIDSVETAGEEKGETQESTEQSEPKIEEPVEEEVDKSVTQVLLRRPSNPEVDVEVAVTMDRDKIKELVTTEISLERQLENVQSQLMALKQLPSEIERHLKVVSEQLHKIMELSGVEHDRIAKEEEEERAASVLAERENEEQNKEDEEAQKQLQEQEEQRHEDEHRTYDVEDGRQSANSESSSWAPNLASLDEDLLTNTESKELEISVKSDKDDGSSVKKYIVSYESKVIEETKAAKRSRDPSPAVSQRSFEADPNIGLHDQLVQELKHRQGRKRSRELWQPQARQLELTYGRRWRCPNDFFNDDMIADVLSSQAEVIRGRAMGVNFKKFEKAKALPNYDHLMASSVYKMIHKMEVEPKKGIPARPSRVVAAEDIIERVNTPVCGMSNNTSVRSDFN